MTKKIIINHVKMVLGKKGRLKFNKLKSMKYKHTSWVLLCNWSCTVNLYSLHLGLFQRAILMSGSGAAPWSLVEDPVHYAVKLAAHLNCTLPTNMLKHHLQIVDCLRLDKHTWRTYSRDCLRLDKHTWRTYSKRKLGKHIWRTYSSLSQVR